MGHQKKSPDYWIVKLNPTAPLPIELLSFAGKNSDENTILQWITASEATNGKNIFRRKLIITKKSTQK